MGSDRGDRVERWVRRRERQTGKADPLDEQSITLLEIKSFETACGIIHAKIDGEAVTVNLTEPYGLALNQTITTSNGELGRDGDVKFDDSVTDADPSATGFASGLDGVGDSAGGANAALAVTIADISVIAAPISVHQPDLRRVQLRPPPRPEPLPLSGP